MSERIAFPSRIGFPARFGTFAAAAAVGILSLTLWSMPYRSIEAWTTARIMNFDRPTDSWRHYWLGQNPEGIIWFDVTTLCSSNLVIAPLLVLAGLGMLLAARIAVWRVVLGFVVAASVFFAFNIGRLVLIGWTYNHWGHESEWIAHDVFGTYVTLIASFVAVGIQLLVTGVRRGSLGHRRFEVINSEE